MTTPIIADSSGLISLISDSDQNHSEALRISQKLSERKGSIVIPSDVFTEVMNVVSKKLGHRMSLKTAHIIQKTRTFTILDSDQELRSQA